MSTTRIADVIVPENYAQYQIEDTKEKAEFMTSGLCSDDPSLAAFVSGGGVTTNLPFWRDLPNGSGAGIASDDPDVKATTDKVQAGKQVAIRNYRTKSWSAANLTSELAGSDPMQRIMSRTNAWWNREFQRAIVSCLDGVMLDNIANDNGDMVLDKALSTSSGVSTAVGEDNLISPEAILDTEQTLGDAKEDLSIMIVHSVIENRLRKQNLIEFKQASETDVDVGKRAYLGKYRIIVDDGAKTVATTISGSVARVRYTTIFAAPGSLKWHETAAPKAVEPYSRPEGGNGAGIEELWTRRQFVVHPYGFAFTGQSAIVDDFPTNAEYGTASNWNRVAAERKQVPMAFLLTNG